jgi:GMP synthase (glutamine-hydrolysing)
VRFPTLLGMRVLSVIHQADAASGVFADAVGERGHELVEWNVAEERRLPTDAFGAVLVFGGAMHVDQQHEHGWLNDEEVFLRRVAADGVPLMGVCLGGQLLAKALGAPVRRMPSPEVGWFPLDLTADAAGDPVFGGLPERFDSFQWHVYAFELPPGAVLLARSERCYQAYRAGEAAWGLQFHAEVTREALEGWIEGSKPEEDGAIDLDRLRAESDERIGRWNELGREICARFLAVAERRGFTRAAVTTHATTPGS